MPLAFSTPLSLPLLSRGLLCASRAVRAAPRRAPPRAPARMLAVRVHTSPESEAAASAHLPKEPRRRPSARARAPPAYADERYAVAVLRGEKARLFRGDGSCLVFAGAVDRVTPRVGSAAVAAAEVVCVVDGVGRKVGYGFYNGTGSMFAVRIVKHVKAGRDEEFDVDEDVRGRVRRAFQVRSSIGLPSADTDVFRAVNGEGDRLSGLSVDMFGRTAVIVSGAIWCERYRGLIERAVGEATKAEFDIDDLRIVWRMSVDRLRQDGSDKITDLDAALIPSLAPFRQTASAGADAAPAKAAAEDTEKDTDFEDVTVRENGVEYVLPSSALRRGQKTGFYADQSVNRLMLRRILSRRQGASVLDCYCYSGGFGISAALGGAGDVTGVDSSAPSLDMARVNAARNDVESKMTFVQSDVPAYLSDAASRGEQWDVVVLDPPKLAPSAKTASLERAARKYQSVNSAALKLVSPGGLLLTCSCSQAMTKDRDVFLGMVRKAAQYAGREVTLLQTSGAGPDHPTDLSEGADAGYLTACLFTVY